MKERYGYDTIEHHDCFLTYRIDGDTCSAFEIYVQRDSRGSVAWRDLWSELLGICRDAGAVRVIGFIDTAAPGPTERMRAYLRNGGKIHGVRGNVIVIEWSVNHGA